MKRWMIAVCVIGAAACGSYDGTGYGENGEVSSEVAQPISGLNSATIDGRTADQAK